MKLSPAKVCSHEDGTDHPLYSCLPYLFTRLAFLQRHHGDKPRASSVQMVINCQLAVCKWMRFFLYGSKPCAPSLPHGSCEKFEQMFRFRGRDALLLLYLLPPAGSVFISLWTRENNSTSLTATWGRGSLGSRFPRNMTN